MMGILVHACMIFFIRHWSRDSRDAPPILDARHTNFLGLQETHEAHRTNWLNQRKKDRRTLLDNHGKKRHYYHPSR